MLNVDFHEFFMDFIYFLTQIIHGTSVPRWDVIYERSRDSTDQFSSNHSWIESHGCQWPDILRFHGPAPYGGMYETGYYPWTIMSRVLLIYDIDHFFLVCTEKYRPRPYNTGRACVWYFFFSESLSLLVLIA